MLFAAGQAEDQDQEHVETHRVGWFDCACCPTNIARLIGSVGQYIYSTNDYSLYVHQFVSSSINRDVAGLQVSLE